jgi:transketolase
VLSAGHGSMLLYALLLTRRLCGELPEGWDADLPAFAGDAKGLARRKASESVVQRFAERLPELVGGSADLNPSTVTWLKTQGDFQAPQARRDGVQGDVGGPWGYAGRNLHFGVPERAMRLLS